MSQNVLDYQSAALKHVKRTIWWKFLLHNLVGFAIAYLSAKAGGWAEDRTNNTWWFLIATVTALSLVMYVYIRIRHYGYHTGFLIPYLIVLGGFGCLCLACRHGG
jgi:hypothetical protein